MQRDYYSHCNIVYTIDNYHSILKFASIYKESSLVLVQTDDTWWKVGLADPPSLYSL